ncbi:hypothetical protein EG346_14680 [Chryseobacterium carnipullorum]|uniref:Uncharacterized protein n=1 Tax=Chryseobacterium carnipullorum TaxID=1124835 RepID=A0A376DTJ7_CHRCU|nr:hypothetical protein [Chryseobacterium carnipullorum]AZA49343.1 hypothetical protein EG346_14680 [Chryseobacterium carnipullorum]AZA64231.1 hypothetical protein EG345_05610 [Chryseobacterium carnipullorum]STC94188.1 Uncharacterised protein [Chryseobacterium carnipullorum]
MELVDLYIHFDKINKENIFEFIKNWLSDFEPEYECFEYPPYFGETEYETEDYTEMLSFVLEKNGRGYRFYFENNGNIKRPKGMIFINKDHSAYLGIGVDPNYEKYFTDKFLEKYKVSPIVCYNGQIPDNE